MGAPGKVLSLELCGGDTTIALALTSPPARACAAQMIVNNSNTAGWSGHSVVHPPNATAGPEWCRAQVQEQTRSLFQGCF